MTCMLICRVLYYHKRPSCSLKTFVYMLPVKQKSKSDLAKSPSVPYSPHIQNRRIYRVEINRIIPIRKERSNTPLHPTLIPKTPNMSPSNSNLQPPLKQTTPTRPPANPPKPPSRNPKLLNLRLSVVPGFIMITRGPEDIVLPACPAGIEHDGSVVVLMFADFVHGSLVPSDWTIV